MAQFTLQWDNTEVNANSNNIEQIVSYRQKSVGGAWITTGFTPGNPLATSDNTTESPVLIANNIYEFKIDSNCTENGPSSNDNGVIEMIGIACITPTMNKTHNTATAIMNLINTDITRVRFTLRKTSDNSIIYGPISVLRSGTTAQAGTEGLLSNTSYYWQTVLYSTINGVEVLSSNTEQLNAICGPHTFLTDAPPVPDLHWRILTKACQKEGGFNITKTISGLSSPYRTWYDEINSVVYVADFDDAAGNVYWFNPNTATVPANMIHSTAIIDPLLYNNYIDSDNRKIYFVGANTNGLLIYDIDTDTTSTVAFGTNGAFSRTLLMVSGNNIYCNDGNTSIIIINRTTLAISSTVTIAGIPTPSHFSAGVISLIAVGATELYAITSNGTEPKVGVYNLALTSLIAEITLTGVVTWDGGTYWQNAFYDETSNQVYIGDIGSNKLFVINAATKTIVHTKTAINRQGKTNAQHSAIIDPITNELYIAFTAQNTSVDGTPLKRLYSMDRTTHEYKNMYENQTYITVSGIPGTANVVGAFAGLPSWSGGGYATDGVITIASNAAGADNTGDEIGLVLEEYDANNGNNPTGNQKNNIPSDVDYFPPAENLSACPLPSGTPCPVNVITTFLAGTLQYEFAIASSVKNNPAILKIEVYAFNTGTATAEGIAIVISNPNKNYYSGNFTGLAGSNYSIQVKYLGTGDVELQTCEL